MVVYDTFGRTWKGRKIVWIKSANSSRHALYRCVVRDGKKRLIYDKKRGMCDKDGCHIKEPKISIIPALEGVGKNGLPEPGTWERFPDTEEAHNFTKSITQSGFVNHEIESTVDIDDVYDEYEDYDEEITII